jgi:hypothetical protein
MCMRNLFLLARSFSQLMFHGVVEVVILPDFEKGSFVDHPALKHISRQCLFLSGLHQLFHIVIGLILTFGRP